MLQTRRPGGLGSSGLLGGSSDFQDESPLLEQKDLEQQAKLADQAWLHVLASLVPDVVVVIAMWLTTVVCWLLGLVQLDGQTRMMELVVILVVMVLPSAKLLVLRAAQARETHFKNLAEKIQKHDKAQTEALEKHAEQNCELRAQVEQLEAVSKLVQNYAQTSEQSLADVMATLAKAEQQMSEAAERHREQNDRHQCLVLAQAAIVASKRLDEGGPNHEKVLQEVRDMIEDQPWMGRIPHSTSFAGAQQIIIDSIRQVGGRRPPVAAANNSKASTGPQLTQRMETPRYWSRASETHVQQRADSRGSRGHRSLNFPKEEMVYLGIKGHEEEEQAGAARPTHKSGDISRSTLSPEAASPGRSPRETIMSTLPPEDRELVERARAELAARRSAGSRADARPFEGGASREVSRGRDGCAASPCETPPPSDRQTPEPADRPPRARNGPWAQLDAAGRAGAPQASPRGSARNTPRR